MKNIYEGANDYKRPHFAKGITDYALARHFQEMSFVIKKQLELLGRLLMIG